MADDDKRPTAAEVNAAQNKTRLNRMEEISRGVDGRRSGELQDVSGENVTGKFAGGELDDSPEAREAAAEQADREAAQALEEAALAAAQEQGEQRGTPEEQAERERQAAARAIAEAEGRARELQEAGGGGGEDEGGGAPAHAEGGAEEAEERVIDGVRYYRTIVAGDEKWLTLKQLRQQAALAGEAEATLQRAEEALQRSTEAAAASPAPPAMSDEELRDVILASGLGDTGAVDKLVSVIRGRATPSTPDEKTITRLVSQQIATQRAIDTAEREQGAILGNPVLEPVFRARLAAFAREKPRTRIGDAYKAVGETMRRDFAPMITARNGERTPAVVPGTKADRKRTLVSPPHGAARTASAGAEEQEPSVSQDIDTIAKARGQDRAIRQVGSRKG